MAKLKSYDEYTYVHAANVTLLTMAQARRLGLSDDLLRDVGIAAMVHDIGKTFIPDKILNKQGKLSPQEWKVISTHPVIGAKYLSGRRDIPKLAVLAAFEHHIKKDKSGYPKVDSSYMVHPCSQMTGIADCYDALSTVRPYRKPMARHKIFEMLREESGTGYEPFLVENFISMMEAANKEGKPALRA